MKIISDKYENLSDFSEQFRVAKPFPHLVLDNFFDHKYFDLLKNLYLKTSNDIFKGKTFNSNAEKNKSISLNTELPDEVSKIVKFLNSNEWINNILNLTGLKSIQSTPVGNKKLANYHEMKPGGVLVAHVDHSSEPDTQLPHVLNIIIFISPKWNSNYGGATLFYDQWGKQKLKKIKYIPNRAIIFLHTPYSFHGVEYLDPNFSSLRRSIYVDYYSKSFQPYQNFNLDFPKHWFKHGTTFKLKEIKDYFRPSHFHYTKALLQYKLNKFLSK